MERRVYERRRSLPAKRVALTLALLALACGPASEAPPAPRAAADGSLALFDRLESARVTGLAARLPGAPGASREVLKADFEDGTLAPLALFTGYGPRAEGDLANVVEGSLAFEGGHSARLRGGVPHGVSLRSAPIPVRPEEVYTLRYRFAAEKLRPHKRSIAGGATVLQYRVPAEDAGRVAERLADPAQEAALRLPPPRDFALPLRRENMPWTQEEIRFGVDPAATHVVVSLDLSRPLDDRAPHQASGTVRFDDVELVAHPVSPAAREPARDQGAGPADARKLAAVLPHPAHADASEQRYAIALPAPSRLAFDVEVPPAGALSFGLGLLYPSQVPDGAALAFGVEVAEPGGAPREVFRRELLPARDRGWLDVDLDLAELAGRRVELALTTHGRPETGDAAADLLRMPESGAVVSYPVLHSRSARGRLLVLVGIDTLPAGATSTYGYAREVTPQLSRIAGEGVRFARALSPSPWTLPAFASMLTGLAPDAHRAGDYLAGGRSLYRPLAPGLLTLVERLRLAGFETRAWVNNPYLTRGLGTAQGFTAHVDYATRGEDEAARPGVDGLLRWIASPRGHARFAFLHLMDPHGPYRSNDAFRARFVDAAYAGPLLEPLDKEAFGEISATGRLAPAERRRVRDFYDAAVAYTDSELGRVFDALRAASAREDVALVVTADHGEEFWEHGYFEHGHSLVNELLQVPLVVWAPGIARAPRVVAAPVSTFDVAATLAELAGLPAPEDAPSRSLVPWLSGAAEPPSGRAFVAENTLYGVQRLALERDGVKYVYHQAASGARVARAPGSSPRHQLFLLAEDPGERTDRFAAEPGRALPLHEALARHFAESLTGCYVVSIDTGGGPRRFSGAFALPAGAAWHPYARDFVWPLADGREAPLRLGTRTANGVSLVEFQIEASRAILGLPVRDGEGPVTFAISVDGRPLERGEVALGAGGTRPDAFPASIPDASLWLDAADALERPGGALVRLGRARDAGGAGASGLGVDEQLRQQLDALGYVRE
jgi:arylsulfatase A-like enzyme